MAKGCLNLFLLMGMLCTPIVHADDPLPSWNDGPIKKKMISFVQTVTNPSSTSYIPPEHRIATFDNDGTLWVEQPLYTQILFAIDRKLAPQHPEWKKQKPFSLILNNEHPTNAQLSLDDLKQILIATHTGMNIEEYHKIAKEWLATTQNPRYHHLYKDMVYQPMLEVIKYLHHNGFQVYIVTGGGQEFVRAFADEVYGINSDRVIGTVGETKYEYKNNKPELIKIPTVLLFNDEHGKPEAINYFIGRKPIIAFGNSDGDRQMLEWTQSGDGLKLMILIHHDDAVREYAYGPDSKIGTFSDSLLNEAHANNWNIVSMKNDWKVLFPFELTKK